MYLAIYLRLSIEDAEKKKESNSITNQRKQIYKYIEQESNLSSYQVIEFCDDGYSGTNMERPAMKKLLEEIEKNHIHCIIVKDMSRFSRDYIEMGTYLNHIFPSKNIRFISINDHYDSKYTSQNGIELTTAFQTLLYDLYSKDISIKVKASIENKCARGEYIFAQVPFGYQKSKEIRNKVIINEKEAKIVRYIFSLAINGKNSTQIAIQLDKERIPTITQMRYPNKTYSNEELPSWNKNVIRSILNNRFYLGEMAYGKTIRKSVGSKQKIAIPKEKWQVIYHHHEALISEELYKKAHDNNFP